MLNLDLKLGSIPTVEKFYEFCVANPDYLCNVTPYEAGSWRGDYSCPCIFVELEYKLVTKLSAFIPFLQELMRVNFTMFGYKGGEYRVSPSDALYIERACSSYSGSESMWDDFEMSFGE